jgi:DNA-binding PadR family transcriptional regulator
VSSLAVVEDLDVLEDRVRELDSSPPSPAVQQFHLYPSPEWLDDGVGSRANLYKTMKRLHKAGLISVRQTEHDQLYPERTIYELTDEGHQAVHSWLVERLSSPRNEFPEFPAAISFAMLLGPEAMQGALERWAERLEERIRAMETNLETLGKTLPRVTLLDDEYLRAVTAAELAWVRGVLADLRSGSLAWGEDLAESARVFVADSSTPGRDG